MLQGNILNTIVSDLAQLQYRGSIHKENHGNARQRHLQVSFDRSSPLWHSKIAEDILSSVKQVADTFDHKQPHQMTSVTQPPSTLNAI